MLSFTLFIPSRAIGLAFALGLLVFTVGAFTADAGRAEAPLGAPYQVLGAAMFRDDRYRMETGLGLQSPRILVDLGNAQDRGLPDAASLREVTIVGTAGVARGTLEDIRKECDYLCGDEGEECHYVGLVVLNGALVDIGTPLVALAGGHELSDFRPWEGTTGMPPAPPRRSVFSPLAWSPYPDYAPAYRIESWDAPSRSLTLAQRDPSGEVVRLQGEQCESAHDGEILSLSCSGFALIVADGRPLLFSYPDYNIAAAQAVATFTLHGQVHYLVRYGAKAQTVFGLIVRGPEGWQALFRPKNYALLC
jgi:hypothetical protein